MGPIVGDRAPRATRPPCRPPGAAESRVAASRSLGPPRGAGGQERGGGPVRARLSALRERCFRAPAPAGGVSESRRHKRYAQRQVLWDMSLIERVRKCGRVPTGEGVTVVDHAGVAHYAGLTTCGSIWACPVCSAKIRAGRAEEIAAGAASWDQAGNSIYMITLTAPHDMGMKLSALLPVIADSFRAVISGRAWLKVKAAAEVAGTIRSVEITHGANGWHPHLHVLVFAGGIPAPVAWPRSASTSARSGTGPSPGPGTGRRTRSTAW